MSKCGRDYWCPVTDGQQLFSSCLDMLNTITPDSKLQSEGNKLARIVLRNWCGAQTSHGLKGDPFRCHPHLDSIIQRYIETKSIGSIISGLKRALAEDEERENRYTSNNLNVGAPF